MNESIIGSQPYGIFVDTNNTVYAASRAFNQVLVRAEGSDLIIRNISSGLTNPYSLFVTTGGDICVDNGGNKRVDKWSLNATTAVSVMNVSSKCYNLFIDIANTLYCSNDDEDKVVKVSLNGHPNDVMIAAGNGTRGAGPYMLKWPNGLVVDMDLKLYVADCGNQRIQLFQPGQLNGTTIIGNGMSGNYTFDCPNGLAIDADGYLIIVDEGNHKVVRAEPNEIRCLVGCSGGSGSASNQLDTPQEISFDSYGNMFISDKDNHRIQKFLFINNSCGRFPIPPLTCGVLFFLNSCIRKN